MSNIAILFASHRRNGRSKELVEMLQEYKQHSFEIIRLSETEFKPCVHCLRCSITGKCMKHLDTFNATIENLKKAEEIIIVSPLYSLIPSRLSAFLERLTSVGYFFRMKHGTSGGPLQGKKCAVICYDSSGVNSMLEGLLKQVLRPCLLDFSKDGGSVNEHIFIEDSQEVEAVNKDVTAHLRYVLSKI
ncbi:MAG: flavodoxin family protein [Clostridia bacterium]